MLSRTSRLKAETVRRQESAGAATSRYLEALDKVLARAPAGVTIIPGHGEVAYDEAK